MSKELLNTVLGNLLEDKFFSEFKFRKRDSRLIRLMKDGFDAVEFQYWEGFDLGRGKSALVVKPLYLKRFDVLHKWLEKYSFKNKTDQRDNFSIGFDGTMLGKQNEFYFLLDQKGFQLEIENLIEIVTMNSTFVFNKFADIKALYEYQVEPILAGKKKLPDVGADWIFEYLTLSKMVYPENYSAVKALICIQVQYMKSKNEPNVMEYYPRLKEIFEHLETDHLSI